MILETTAESQFRGLVCCFFLQLLSSRLPFRSGAATSSSSSSPSSSSITAAVMLALAEPPMSGAPQNGVSVECRWQRGWPGTAHFRLWGHAFLYCTAAQTNQTSTILYLKLFLDKLTWHLSALFLWRKSTMDCFSSSNNCFQLVWELCVW